jgi:hypothetical protein
VAVAFVQIAGTVPSATGNPTVTLGVNTTQGNVLVMYIRCAGGVHPTAISDSRGNTWNLDVISGSSNSAAHICSAYLATALLSGDTISVTMSASSNREIGVAEYSGLQIVSGAPVLDQSASTHNASSGAITAATTATSSAGDLVVSAVACSANAGTFTLATSDPDSGGTWHDHAFSVNGVDGAYQIGVGSASLYSVTWTPASSTNADCSIASYKAAGSAVSGGATLTGTGSAIAAGGGPPGATLTGAGSLAAAPVSALAVTGTSSAGSGAANVSSQAVNNPGWNGSGTPAGLLILLWSGSVNATDTFACTGFTAATVANGSNIAQQLLWRVSDGSEGATFTVTMTGSFIVVIGGIAVSGADTSSPFDPSLSGSGTCLGSVGTTLTAPGITTGQNGDLLIWLATGRLGAGAAVPAITPPSGFTTALAQADSGGGAGHANVDVYAATMTQTTAGATGALSGTLAASADGGALLISVAAPGGPVPGTVSQLVAGAPAAAGFQVYAKTSGATSCRLAYSTSPSMTSPSYITAQTPDASGYLRYTLTGLSAFTRYYVQVADTPSGGMESLIGPIGACKTLATAGTPANYTVALVSCIAQGDTVTPPATAAAISDWISYGADLNVFTGDFDYSGTTSTVLATQVGVYETQIGFIPSLSSMVATAWGYYCRSDHEAGPDNGDSDNTYTATNIAAAQSVFPMGVLGDTVNSPPHGLYQAWVSGRVRFIMIDIRNTDRSPGGNTDNGTKTMLGATQLAWLENQLIQPEPLKVIISDVAWMGTATITNGPDKWWSYDTERQAIISYIAANRHLVKNVVLWHGDSHLVGCTVGANNSWGGFPVYCAAPLLNVGGGLMQTTFDQHYSNSGGECRQYGRLAFTDNGSSITVAFQGWDAVAGIAQVSQTDVFPTPSADLAGAGSLAAGGGIAGAAGLTGAGSVSAPPAVQRAGTALDAAGSVAAPSAQRAGTALTGAGSIPAGPAQQTAVMLAAAGSLGTAPGLQPAAVTLTAAGTLAAGAVQQAGAAPRGAGSVNAPASAVQAGKTLGGAASLAAGAALAAGAITVAGRASLSAGPAGQAGATLAGAGSLSSTEVQGGGAALDGTGNLTVPVTLRAGAPLTATGTLTGGAAQGAAVTLTGTGSVATGVTQQAGAVLGAAASITGGTVQGSSLPGAAHLTAGAGVTAPATMAGTGSVTAGAAGQAATTLAAAGQLTTTPGQRATTSLTAAGAITGSGGGVTPASAPLTAAGSLPATAAAVTSGTTTLTASAALTTAARTSAAAALTALGTLTAPTAARAPAVLAGTGTLTAAAGQLLAFTVGTLTGSTAAQATLTAADQRTGGPD